MIDNISPIDGRYHSKLIPLKTYFSEYALIKYRLHVEVEYLIALAELLPQLNPILEGQKDKLRQLVSEFSIAQAEEIKIIEQTTNHDVKAVEYFLKAKIHEFNLDKYKEFVHFALTSQDINNTAIPMLMQDFAKNELIPLIRSLHTSIEQCADDWKSVPMLARTHGQAASPTTMGKEFAVFADRIHLQLTQLINYNYTGKFGGATGNFNAHIAAYPTLDWLKWSNEFLEQNLGIKRIQRTTQIAHYDEIAEWCHILIRLNTIMIDFSRDVWTYISMDYFKQKLHEKEIGSSAMPHKVNPIDFENAEGNLGMSTAIASHLAEKLPVSRLQRDLTDSTVLRNIGVPVAYTYLAILSLKKGISKLILNKDKLTEELSQQWIILAEAIQTILRRENYADPYETLKSMSRGKSSISQNELWNFIDSLDIDDAVKSELKQLRPENYIGNADKF